MDDDDDTCASDAALVAALMSCVDDNDDEIGIYSATDKGETVAIAVVGWTVVTGGTNAVG